MFYNLLSTRAIQVGIVFFVLVVGGSLLYSWHTECTTESDLARHDRFTRGLEKPSETRPAATRIAPTENETPSLLKTPDENTDTQMSDESEALPNDTETIDLADAFFGDLVSEEEIPTEEVAVSPFGFGRYPEVPADFPFNTKWGEMSRENELCTRVMVKAWTHGERFLGATADRDTGQIWLNYPKTVYVKSTKKNVRGGSITIESRRIRHAGDVEIPPKGSDFPPDVRVLDFDSSAIDPYAYLGLPR